MKEPRTLRSIVLVLCALVLFVLSGGVAWASVQDYGHRGTIPLGVSIGGIDIGGMSDAEARSVVEAQISEPLLTAVTVEASGQALSFDPKDAVSIDVDGMLEEAHAVRKDASFLERLSTDLRIGQNPKEIELRYTVDEQAVRSWVAEAASHIDSPAVDASYVIENAQLVLTHSAAGAGLDQTATAAAIMGAISAESTGTRAVTASYITVQPTVTEADLGTVIVVSLSQRKVKLYKEGELVKTYPCAVGRAPYYTPKGDWKVIDKRKNPSWSNPGSDWAKSMPAYIPGGPSSPLGTRAIYLNAPGIRLHGTTNIASVGTAASHGCMRMYRKDIEELYELVPIGAKVYIRS
ncbi:MAG: L,D-transpeptidase family protein [Coriobacteriia bacterium]